MAGLRWPARVGFEGGEARAELPQPRLRAADPCPIPKRKKGASYPLALIIEAMGTTVKADPAPNPMAVSPAASPRRSGNHLRALPTQVPYTAPAPIPPMTA